MPACVSEAVVPEAKLAEKKSSATLDWLPEKAGSLGVRPMPRREGAGRCQAEELKASKNGGRGPRLKVN